MKRHVLFCLCVWRWKNHQNPDNRPTKKLERTDPEEQLKQDPEKLLDLACSLYLFLSHKLTYLVPTTPSTPPRTLLRASRFPSRISGFLPCIVKACGGPLLLMREGNLHNPCEHALFFLLSLCRVRSLGMGIHITCTWAMAKWWTPIVWSTYYRDHGCIANKYDKIFVRTIVIVWARSKSSCAAAMPLRATLGTRKLRGMGRPGAL